MTRFASLSAAAIASFMLLSATAATAQSNTVFYAAKPVAESSAKLVVRDTLWKCGTNGCISTTKGTSRPAFVCEALVKEVGAIASFRAGAQEFDAEALAKCNARA